MKTDVPSEVVAMTGREIEEQPWEPFGGLPHTYVKYLFSSQSNVAGLMRLGPGSHEARHLHVGGQHHAWVLEGTVEFDGKRLASGGYIHVPHDTEHTMRTDEEGATLLFVFVRHE